MPSILFRFGVLLVAGVCAMPLAIYGGFDDSLVYYEQADVLWRHGLIAGSQIIFAQTGKYEFGFVFPLWLQGLVPILRDKFWFLFFNGFVINLLLSMMYLKVAARGRHVRRLDLVVSVFILVFGYYTYSNSLYVWRTVWAISFFWLFMLEGRFERKALYLFVAFSFHYSIFIFFLNYAFIFLMLQFKFKSRFIYLACFILVGVLAYFIVFGTGGWGALLSGGGVRNCILNQQAHSIYLSAC